MTRHRAIIFDMDGTLVDSERLAFRAWGLALAGLGRDFSRAHFLQMLGKTGAELEQVLTGFYGRGLPLHECIDSYRAIREELAAQEGVLPKPGAAEIAQALRAAGQPYCVATSTPQELAVLRLGQAGLAELYPQVIGGDRVAGRKPAPDIYLYAAQVIGAPAGECLAIEDSAVGAESARRAGMPYILVPDMLPPDATSAAGALAVCDDLFVVLKRVLGAK